MLPALIPIITTLLPEAVKFFTDDAGDKVVDQVSGLVKGVTGIDDMDAATKAIMADPDKALALKELLIKNKHKLDEMYLADRQDARSMYKDENEQADKIAQEIISKNIWYICGVLIFQLLLLTVVPIWLPIDTSTAAIVGNVCGWVINGLLSERQSVTAFFFGSSKGSKNKDKIKRG